MIERVTIYGYGYVGKATAEFLAGKCEMQIYDPAFPKGHANLKLDWAPCGHMHPAVNPGDHLPSDYAIVCVPTPSLSDGSCDTSIVESVVTNRLHESYLIKSTIPPGTTDCLVQKTRSRVVFSPEYIGEGRYPVPHWKGFPHPTDMKTHEFFIFGGTSAACQPWVELWQRVAGWAPRYFVVDSTTAELTKYAENAYLACKKIFADELYDACKTFGVDYNVLRELWLADGRIGPAMTLVYPDKRGFDGKCLPKDLSAIIHVLEERGHSAEFWKEIIRSNARVRGESK